MINDNNQPLLIDGVSSELLEGLTPEQQDVLKRDSQNLLVNAGAGSGKTTVLTKRVIHLLKDKNYSLDEMIVLTFTDLAAKQMKDKIIKALKNETNPKLKDRHRPPSSSGPAPYRPTPAPCCAARGTPS